MKPNHIGGFTLETRKEIRDAWQARNFVVGYRPGWQEKPAPGRASLDLGRVASAQMMEHFHNLLENAEAPDELRITIQAMVDGMASPASQETKIELLTSALPNMIRRPAGKTRRYAARLALGFGLQN